MLSAVILSRHSYGAVLLCGTAPRPAVSSFRSSRHDFPTFMERRLYLLPTIYVGRWHVTYTSSRFQRNDSSAYTLVFVLRAQHTVVTGFPRAERAGTSHGIARYLEFALQRTGTLRTSHVQVLCKQYTEGFTVISHIFITDYSVK